ncbi:hypothetical protein RCC89_18060 [Cytophagaceae bacterium ABcell3]|nr:hypothetical protein RCC89_18060 [Cytophagaceae bacterium ABcell3]
MRVVASLVFAFFACFTINAQDNKAKIDSSKLAREKAEKQAMFLKQELNLSDNQVQEIISINYTHGKELKNACQGLSGTEVAEVYDQIQHSREEAMKKVLTKDQYQVYQKIRYRSEWANLDFYKKSELEGNEFSADTLDNLHYADACVKDSTKNKKPNLKARKDSDKNAGEEKDEVKREDEEGISLRTRKNSFSYPLPEEGFDNEDYAKAMKDSTEVY